ncbi:hypothetical protein JX580_08145 [Thiomicrospira microaerophila]|uniref:type II secretion system protein n=1 Tax=Thiomicrospira microaerophila TaxID=406020 RepID=UPI00200C80DE|nr:prepilin-type N-terminal cleavage/methylation domain-containing protein [Thiomicrospira microaerophila]UQB41643.1 hypothetical protein JX580_08145 [Thiomicrospira microaerophila]
MQIKHDSNLKGFTLLEIALIIAILGIVMVGVLLGIGGVRESAKYVEDQQKLADIKSALLRFVTINGYLPCPDTSDPITEAAEVGFENRGGDNQCQATSGTLPFIDLGTHRFNAYNQAFSYHINQQATDETLIGDANQSASYFGRPNDFGCVGNCFNRNTPPNALNLGSGNINIDDATSTLMERLPVVVISHGKNGCVSHPDANYIAPTDPTFEIRNCHYNSPTYYQVPQLKDHFDDVLIGISALEIKQAAGLFSQASTPPIPNLPNTPQKLTKSDLGSLTSIGQAGGNRTSAYTGNNSDNRVEIGNNLTGSSPVNLAGGNNALYIGNQQNSSISAGEGDNQIVLEKDAKNPITLGDGDNQVTIMGNLDTTLTLGNGDNEIWIEGQVSNNGKILLGSGSNLVFVGSHILSTDTPGVLNTGNPNENFFVSGKTSLTQTEKNKIQNFTFYCTSPTESGSYMNC